MSSHDDASATALLDVSARVDEALRARRRQQSSIGSADESHVSVGSYVAIGSVAVPALVAAGRLSTSRGTLVSSRLGGPHAPAAAGAAGLFWGGFRWWIPDSGDTACSRLTRR